MIVIGTAGHIDHGKSSLVKRLTGTDPDRLPEEQARGMTIDLGFAFYTTSKGEEIAFVDVPGHERFVRTMIAGAGSIDAVMLVIAADDGWMPQSQEHAQIIRLLGVRHGIIVINKCDLVESDWLDLLEKEIRQNLVDSFLASVPAVRVSALRGDGFDRLTALLEEMPAQITARRDIGKARLSIDRSFLRPGIGAVATGTLRGGSLRVGQQVSVWPTKRVGKIRTLQSHNDNLTEVHPGHRTAISLTGFERDDLPRGGVINSRLDLSPIIARPVLALHAELLSDCPVVLEDRRRVLLLTGTAESEGEVRLRDFKPMGRSDKGILFFKPDSPLLAYVGDRFIMRLPTPMVTLGGGMILDHLPMLPKRREYAQYGYLDGRVSGSALDLTKTELEKQILTTREGFLEAADLSGGEIDAAIEQLTASGVCGRSGSIIFHVGRYQESAKQVRDAMGLELRDQSHARGLTTEQVLRLSPFDAATTTALLGLMTERGEISREGDLYNLQGRSAAPTGPVAVAAAEIMSELQVAPFAPPGLSQLAARGKSHQQAIRYLIESRQVYKCGSEFLFLVATWETITNFIRQRLAAHSSLAVTDLKEHFDLTRKYAIPILEETDRLGLTARQGDVRVKGRRFDHATGSA